jgi:hypothetical protein
MPWRLAFLSSMIWNLAPTLGCHHGPDGGSGVTEGRGVVGAPGPNAGLGVGTTDGLTVGTAVGLTAVDGLVEF